jgi:tripartite-type tricarboxylate transporter receptor subunit TctC
MAGGRLLAFGTLAALIALPCLAQYPEKPVRIVSPFVAGGLGDVALRLISQRLSRSLGQTVVIDAKPGADGQIAAMEARRSAPDGYTLFAGETTSMSMIPAARLSPPYDPIANFTPIGHIASGAFFLVIHAGIPGKTLKDFVDQARATPDKFAFASSNASSLLASIYFMRYAQIRMLHVPYRGEPPAMPDLVGGRVQFMIATPFLVAQPVHEGKLRVLAAVLPQRGQAFPEAPTLHELGYAETPLISWVGLFGPAKLPPSITARWSAELKATLALQDLRNELDRRGALPRSSSPEELGALVRTQLKVWQDAVREGLIPPE